MISPKEGIVNMERGKYYLGLDIGTDSVGFTRVEETLLYRFWKTEQMNSKNYQSRNKRRLSWLFRVYSADCPVVVTCRALAVRRCQQKQQ